MSRKWYPIIVYELCTGCGACYRNCRLGVLKLQENKPIIECPKKCIKGCHGCGNICPEGAIRYAHDRSGWIPPVNKRE